MLVSGVLAVADPRRRFLPRIDRYGVTWRIRTGSGAVPWYDVLGFAIERSPDDPINATPNHLTLSLRASGKFALVMLGIAVVLFGAPAMGLA